MKGPAVSMPKVKADDVLVLVMGLCGAGKSTFINKIIGNDVAKCDSGFAACTLQVRGYQVSEESELYGRLMVRGCHSRLILVDTPGLDSDEFSDTLVFKSIMACLKNAARKKATIAGIIYLYCRGTTRMREEKISDLEVFHRIFGSRFWPRVIFAATHGDSSVYCPGQVVHDDRNTFWQRPLRSGARRVFLHDSPESAATFLNLLARENVILLLGETGVGKSRFINDLAGENWALENANLEGTPTIAHYDIPFEEKTRLTTFVDCPGYNMTFQTEKQINSMIRSFFTESLLFTPMSKVAGILCLAEIPHILRSPTLIRILSSAKLTCPKLLAVTDSTSKLQPRTVSLTPFQSYPDITAFMESNNVLSAQYPYNSKSYARPLLQLMDSIGTDSLPVALFDTFLDEILPM